MMTIAMIEMAHSIKMLVYDSRPNSNTLLIITPVTDRLSKARSDAFKIVEAMWKEGEVGDEVLLIVTTIFQDYVNAEMLLTWRIKGCKGLL
ncbi:hypothetical protein AMTR_s00104p00130640 [Amborella trichopoda]|uniref:Uncharacterized protein n=1 Tax=Amborella trichopoda TaxID=13333 RepID=W1NYC6_AMBTC|nr:hypothetical protein AMTR_s00104p00130640 [Amborella trichopoda]